MSANFNQLVDYFNLEGGNLQLKSSDAGKGRAVTMMGANGVIVADFVAPSALNPVCVYEVVRAHTFELELGAKAANANAMIVSAVLATTLGNPPTITVSAVGNEGAAAVNRFTLSIPILARHRPQNLLNCVSLPSANLLDLNGCMLSASVVPTVLAPKGTPVASDVTEGRLEAQVDIFGTAGTAGDGWTDTGDNVSCGGTQYRHTVRKFYKIMEAD